MQVVRVSGTIKKAEEEAIRRARLSIKRARSQATGATMSPTSAKAGESDQTMRDGAGEMEDRSAFADGIEDPDEPGDVDDESE